MNLIKPFIPPFYFHGIDIPVKDRENIILKPKVYLYEPAGGVLPSAGGSNVPINKDEVHILPDADFMLSAWFLSVYTFNTRFTILITDSTGYEIYSGFVRHTAMGNNTAPTYTPAAFCVPHAIPAAGKIYISTTVATGFSDLPLQIAFVGISVYRPKSFLVPQRRIA